jgi:hypothetical protein
MSNPILDKIKANIDEFNESLLKLAESSNNYIQKHNEYINKNMMDASLIKKRIKEKIVGVMNENK